MTFDAQELQQAEQLQMAAATSGSPQVRVVAGPGTGKSRCIEERVGFLIRQGINPATIAAVSFTNASARDLKDRIEEYAQQQNLPRAAQVRVSTLHSLALRILRRAGQLAQYPTAPLVMDNWEIENILELEFSITSGYTPGRCKKIRVYNEAYWSTGQFSHPNYVPPNPPITPIEQQTFQNYYTPRMQLYSSVLPGDIIRQSVQAIHSGTINLAEVSGAAHFIVDEYQDLNPMDQDFVKAITDFGAITFVAGDDDQSVYWFRFADPSGIQDFLRNHPLASGHTLQHCFRCPPEIINAAEQVLLSNPSPNRIPKHLQSMWQNSNPPVSGTVVRCRWPTGDREADAIAQACHDLIDGGIAPNDIMILISDKRILGSNIVQALDNFDVPHTNLQPIAYIDNRDGRFVLAILRIVSNPDDYTAHRIILGLLRGVGGQTLDRIADHTIANSLNFKNLFYQNIPNGVFSNREIGALQRAAAICSRISQWDKADDVQQRTGDIGNLLDGELGTQAMQDWLDIAGLLPQGATLDETRALITARTDEQHLHVLSTIHERLELPWDQEESAISQVRIMTMHGAKGLSAKVVFVPGLEEEIFPGPYRQPYPGLISEAARLLYVSITRAQAACVLSYARSRRIYGSRMVTHPSRFANHTGGAFVNLQNTIPAQTIANIISDCNLV